MEQTRERISDPVFDPAKPSLPPSLEQFVFSPAPAIGAEVISPVPASESLSTETITADSGSVNRPTEASPIAGEPPSGPGYLFQFRPQAIDRSFPGASGMLDLDDTSSMLSKSADAYFRQMLAQIESFPVSGDTPAATLHMNSQAASVIGRLKAKCAAQALKWEDLDRMEIALLSVMPENGLPGYGRTLRARYREATGSEFVSEQNDGDLPPESLRAALASLLSELQQRRHLLPEQSRQRKEISQKSAAWIVSLCLFGMAAVGIGLFLPVPPEAQPLLLLFAAVLSGAVGGFTSLLIRTQRTRLNVIAGHMPDSQTWLGSPFVLPVLGAVFAAVLFFVFASCVSRPFLSGTLAGTSRLLLCGFASGLAAGILPSFQGKPRDQRAQRHTQRV